MNSAVFSVCSTKTAWHEGRLKMLPGLEHLIMQCAPMVAPSTMAAIVQVESRGNPLALNVNGSRGLTRQPASRAEAKAWAQWLVEHGYNIDMGLAQVNVRHLQRMGVSIGDAFDPCINLRMGAKILVENYQNASHAYGRANKRCWLRYLHTTRVITRVVFRTGMFQRWKQRTVPVANLLQLGPARSR